MPPSFSSPAARLLPLEFVVAPFLSPLAGAVSVFPFPRLYYPPTPHTEARRLSGGNHSSAAFSLAEQRPIGWFKAKRSFCSGATWLNESIIYGGCYAEADQTSGSSVLDGPTVTANPTAMPGARASTTNAIPPTGRPEANGALDRDRICSLWKAAYA